MNERELLNLLRTVLKALRAIQQDARAIYEQYRTSSHEQKPPTQANFQTQVGLPPSVGNYYESEEHERPRKNRRDRIRLIMEGIGIAAAILAAIFTYCMLRQVHRQADIAQQQIGVMQKQFEAADRPWIDVDILITSPLVYDGNAVRTGFTFVVTNIGRSPAQNVAIIPMLTPAFFWDDLRQIQKRVCDDAAAQTGMGSFRYILFPGHPFTEQVGLDIAVKDLDSHLGKMPPEVLSINLPMPIALVGCVDYTYASSIYHHQTAFAVDLLMKDRGLPLKNKTPISPGDLILSSHPVSSHYPN